MSGKNNDHTISNMLYPSSHIACSIFHSQTFSGLPAFFWPMSY